MPDSQQAMFVVIHVPSLVEARKIVEYLAAEYGGLRFEVHPYPERQSIVVFCPPPANELLVALRKAARAHRAASHGGVRKASVGQPDRPPAMRHAAIVSSLQTRNAEIQQQ